MNRLPCGRTRAHLDSRLRLVRRDLGAVYRSLIVLTLLAGCREDSPAPDRTSVARVSSVGKVQVAAAPALLYNSIAAGSEPTIARIGSAVLGSKGTVVLTDLAASQVVVIDSQGRVIRRIGGRGEGPGEFRSPSWIGRCSGDSLIVWDPRLRRISKLSPDGSIMGQLTPPFYPVELQCGPQGLIGAIIVDDPAASAPLSENAPLIHGSLLVTRTFLDTVAFLRQLPFGRSRPLGAKATFALEDGTLIYGFPDSARAQIWDLTTGSVVAIPAGHANVVPTDSIYAAAVEDILSVMAVPAEREPFRTSFLDIPMPATVPSYRAIKVDHLSRLWIVTSPLGTSRTEIEIRDQRGNAVAAVQLAGTHSLLDVDESRFLTLSRDSLDSQVLSVYSWRMEPNRMNVTD